MVHMTHLVGHSLEKSLELISDCLKRNGFRILTRVDLHQRVKEKTGKIISPIIVIGVFNLKRIIEVFSLPRKACDVFFRTLVIRELGLNQFSVEVSRPALVAESLESGAAQRFNHRSIRQYIPRLIVETDQILVDALAKIESY